MTASLTLGIEEEYLLIDPTSRDLVAEPPAGFMPACVERLGDRVAHEFLQAQVEIGTPVCADIGAARAELVRLRGTVIEVAAAHGMAVIAASTHPFARWRDQKRVIKSRYDALADDLQMAIRRMAICGMHIHAAVEDEELRIDLMNQASYFLPHLLAYSTSSPFWQGQDTGLSAYRPTVFRDMPRTGLPEFLGGHAEWRAMLDVFKETGLCDDGSQIWWDMRPSLAYPTLEMRVCDVCTTLEDALAVAALYQALLGTLVRLRGDNRSWRVYRRTLISENKWRAQRYGVRGKLADFGRRRLSPFAELTEELIELVAAEAERLGGLDSVRHLRELVRRGTSSERQRAAYAGARADGADDAEALRAVVDWLIAETARGVVDRPAGTRAAPSPRP